MKSWHFAMKLFLSVSDCRLFCCIDTADDHINTNNAFNENDDTATCEASRGSFTLWLFHKTTHSPSLRRCKAWNDPFISYGNVGSKKISLIEK